MVECEICDEDGGGGRSVGGAGWKNTRVVGMLGWGSRVRARVSD